MGCQHFTITPSLSFQGLAYSTGWSKGLRLFSKMFALWPPLVLLFCCMPITQLNLCKPLSCRRRWCRKCSHLGLLNRKRRKPCKSHWLLLKPELLLQECQILLINFQIYTSGWLWQWLYYLKNSHRLFLNLRAQISKFCSFNPLWAPNIWFPHTHPKSKPCQKVAAYPYSSILWPIFSSKQPSLVSALNTQSRNMLCSSHFYPNTVA